MLSPCMRKMHIFYFVNPKLADNTFQSQLPLSTRIMQLMHYVYPSIKLKRHLHCVNYKHNDNIENPLCPLRFG